jgi:hypothetical protein
MTAEYDLPQGKIRSALDNPPRALIWKIEENDPEPVAESADKTMPHGH